MTYITLQQISSKQAKKNRLNGLNLPVKQKELAHFLSKEEQLKIKEIFGESSIHLWGAKYASDDAWANMIDNQTLVLFREASKIIMRGVSVYKAINVDLAEYLWGVDNNGTETWPLIYFIHKFQKIDIPVKKVNEYLGFSADYNWQGLNTVGGTIAETCALKLVKELKKRRI